MKLVIGVLLWLILFFIFAIPLTVLSLFKLVLLLHYCFFSSYNRSTTENTELLPITSGDCVLPMKVFNVGFVLKVGGQIKVDTFRQHFAKCFNLSGNGNEQYSKFFSYHVIRFGYVFRARSKTNLNLSEHIFERNLEENEILEGFLAKWMQQIYPEKQPWWEVAVIPFPSVNTGSEPITAICFKMHHGLCDGYSLVHIIDKLTNTTSPYLVKDFQDSFCVQLKQMLEAPLNLRRFKGVSPGMNPFKFSNKTSAQRNYKLLYSFTSFELSDLKMLRRKNGNVHMTSVIWTVITGAFRRYLKEERLDVPEFIKVGNTLPWPRHPAMSPNTRNDEKLCNHWVSGVFEFPLREPDPIIRLQQIEKEYNEIISMGLDKFAKRVLNRMFWALPLASLESKLSSADIGICSGLTSLVGADSYPSLLGSSILNFHPISAIHETFPYMPISCFTFSHSGKLEFTMKAIPSSIVKDQQVLDIICQQFCHDEMDHFISSTVSLKA